MCDRKLRKEAKALLKRGDSAAKERWYRPPDWGDAATCYSKAADGFFKLQMLEQAKHAYEKAAIAYDKENLQPKSGELLAHAAQTAFLLSQPEEGVRLLLEAKVRYLEGNQAIAAVRQMRDAAQKVRKSDARVACELYGHLLDVVENEEIYHWEKESFVDYAILCLELEDYEACFAAWERAKKAFLFLKNTDDAAHCVCSEIAIHIQRGDMVAAERLFSDEMQEDYFIQTGVFSMIDYIVRGVANNNGDVLELGQKHFVLPLLKPEISKIICSFKAPKAAPPEEDKRQSQAGKAPVTEEERCQEEDDARWLL
jgi:tetratricopeptide (TPR) repeat protein